MKAIQAVPGSAEYQAQIDEIQDQLRDYRDNPRLVQSPEELEKLEQEIRELTEQLGALITGQQIQHSLDSEELQQAQSKLLSQWPHRLRNHDCEEVWVRTASGYPIRVKARYFRRKGNRTGKRRYRGYYLGLLLLGIHERCSPGFAAEVSLLAAMLGSLAEATQVLAERGVRIDIKVVRRITYRFSQRARLTQRLHGLGFADTLGTRSVVVSMDGGRIRLKEKKRGRKTAKGRSRYKGAWREPKLFIIYVVNAEGKIERSFMPVMDASLAGPDALFTLLGSYLEQLGISEAERVLFVADGARWIWNRIAGLVHRLGLKAEQVYEMLDFYHAVEHLGKVAGLRKVGVHPPPQLHAQRASRGDGDRRHFQPFAPCGNRLRQVAQGRCITQPAGLDDARHDRQGLAALLGARTLGNPPQDHPVAQDALGHVVG